MTHSSTPDSPAPDPTDELRQQLAQANQRIVQAELKSHALRAGIIDLDCLKLLDAASLQLDESGNLPDFSAALETLRRDKPWAFLKSNSSHPSPPPPPEPAKTRLARDMSFQEWQKARDRLIRGR